LVKVRSLVQKVYINFTLDKYTSFSLVIALVIECMKEIV
jgi:hypothetical protein